MYPKAIFHSHSFTSPSLKLMMMLAVPERTEVATVRGIQGYQVERISFFSEKRSGTKD